MNFNQSIEEIRQAISEKGVLVYPKLSKEEVESFNVQYNTNLPMEYSDFINLN